jgi:hypothetical protein
VQRRDAIDRVDGSDDHAGRAFFELRDRLALQMLEHASYRFGSVFGRTGWFAPATQRPCDRTEEAGTEQRAE